MLFLCYPKCSTCQKAKAWLEERSISMAAATSSPRTHVTRALERLGLLPYLQAVFKKGEVGTCKLIFIAHILQLAHQIPSFDT